MDTTDNLLNGAKLIGAGALPDAPKKRFSHKAVEAQLFNAGSDARIRGEACDAKPLQWRKGWRNVHLTWGKGAKWPVLALPEV